jgi:uncharacterized protein
MLGDPDGGEIFERSACGRHVLRPGDGLMGWAARTARRGVGEESRGCESIGRNRQRPWKKPIMQRLVVQHHLRTERLLPELQGRVFHVTTRDRWRRIDRDGEIKTNKDGALGHGYGPPLTGCVCCWDLRAWRTEMAAVRELQFFFCGPPQLGNELAFLVLAPEAATHLVVASDSDGNPARVPMIRFGGLNAAPPEPLTLECWSETNVPLTAVERVLLVSVLHGEDRDARAPSIRPIASLERKAIEQLKASRTLAPFIDTLIEGFPLSLVTTVHGPSHWARVRDNGLRLAAVTGADPRAVELFAVFHDALRMDEHRDPTHGHRAAALLATIPADHLGLSEAARASLVHAVRFHMEGWTEGDSLARTAWDADRLDLGRVGIMPARRLLCTDAARGSEILEWAFGNSLEALDDDRLAAIASAQGDARVAWRR